MNRSDRRRKPAAPVRDARHGRGEGVDRETVLARLRAALVASDASRPVVLTGPPGVGTSWVAREYVRRHGGAYAHVAWVGGGDKLSQMNEVAGAAEALGVPVFPGAGLSSTLLLMRSALATRDDWLLVVNDGGGGTRNLMRMLPVRGAGHVLVAATGDDWGAAEVPALGETGTHHGDKLGVCPRTFAVDPLTRAEAIALLLDHAGEDPAPGAAARIVGLLGTSPGPLVLAGGHARRVGLEAAYGDLRAGLVPRFSAAPTPEAALTLAWTCVSAALDDNAAALLLRWAALDNALIPPELAWGWGLPREAEAGETLEALGMAARSPAGVWVRPHHRALTLAVASPEVLAPVLDEAWQRVLAVTPDEGADPEVDRKDDALWARWNRLAPHAMAVAVRAFAPGAKGGPAPAAAMDFTERLVAHYGSRSDNLLSCAVYGAFLAPPGCDRADPPTALRAYVGVGRAALRARQPTLARHYLAPAVKLAAKLAGPAAVVTGEACLYLGDAEEELGRPAEALALAKRALAIAETAESADLRVWMCAARVGHLSRLGGDLAGARAGYQRALDGAPDDGSRDGILADLALVLHQTGDLAGARAAYEQVVAPGRDDLPSDVAVGFARLLRALGDLAAVGPVCARAMIYRCPEYVVRPDFEAAELFAEAGEAALVRGDRAAAARHFAQALDLLDATAAEAARPRPDDPTWDAGDDAMVAFLRGQLARAQGDLDAALGHLTRAQALAGQGQPPASFIAAAAGRVAAEVRAARGDAAQAWETIERALPAARAALGEHDPDVAGMLRLLAAGRAAGA